MSILEVHAIHDCNQEHGLEMQGYSSFSGAVSARLTSISHLPWLTNDNCGGIPVVPSSGSFVLTTAHFLYSNSCICFCLCCFLTWTAV